MAVPTETLDASGVGFAQTTPAAPRSSAPGAAPEFPVTEWDRYTFIRQLGEGGMGTVYEARDVRLGRAVALKFIRGGDPRLAMRLAQEARAQARIDHPGVCKVFEVGDVEGKAYIAMQLVDGLPLAGLAPHLSLHDKVQIIRDAALALHEAHKLGILHRDVKPSNILVEADRDGRLRPIVMDFGIAREEGGESGLTETGALLGTPAYMSPEQARGGGRGLDRRSDVYSLGATLYELLAGGPPFAGDSIMTVVLAVLNEEPQRLRTRMPQVPEDLETIVAKCLNKEPGQRYDSARALADDLDRYIAGEPILGRRESLLRRARRTARKHRAAVAMAALALAAATIAGGLALRARTLARQQTAALEAEVQTGRELGQDVKEMEWFLRSAHLLPLHDVTRERSIVRERMKSIAARAPASRLGAALVDYAVGRGHLALREDAEAHERLDRASRAGLDTPELHYALGLVLGRLYQREMVEARRGGAPTWVERRTREIEAQYLTPALAAMDRSRAVRLEAPSYLDGLVAFYRKDYALAQQLARRARDEAPWLYEAWQLEADVLLTRGVERRDRGDNEEAARDLDAAARLFDEAAEIGRSDSALYEGSAEARIRRLGMNVLGTAPPGGDYYQGAVDRCAKAAVARPDRSEPYTEMAFAYHFQAPQAQGEEARALLAKALMAAERALAIGGGDFATYERLSGANFSIALDQIGHALEPRGSIDAAVANARLAVAVSAHHPWGHAALATALGLRGQIKVRSGEDPATDFTAALDESWRATQIDGDYAIGYSNILESYVHLARWYVERGEDPAPATREAATAFAECIRANPRFSECFENAGGVDAWLGAYRVLAGTDAREPLERARANLEKAAALAKNVENRQRLAHVHLLVAEDALRRREDAQPALVALAQTLADCYRLGASDPLCTQFDAASQIFAAELEGMEARPARPALERARALAALAVSRNERDADAYQLLAEAEQQLSTLGATPAEQRRHHAAGLLACARGLALKRNHPHLLAVKGELLLGRARAAAEEDRAALAGEAREALRRAFALNPLLRRTAGSALDEAVRLAGAG
jgi:serine/threonine-protein kinase